MPGLIATWLANRTQREAQQRLAAMVAARRASPEIVDFRKRRAAALMGVGRVAKGVPDEMA